MDERNRLAELEKWIEQKKAMVGLRKFSRNSSCYPEFNEYIRLKTKLGTEANQVAAKVRANGGWRDEPVTGAQVAYLSKLGVKIEPGMTKGRASDLIDAAKTGDLGSIGGWRTDGSN
jgi:hypothetical protein